MHQVFYQSFINFYYLYTPAGEKFQHFSVISISYYTPATKMHTLFVNCHKTLMIYCRFFYLLHFAYCVTNQTYGLSTYITDVHAFGTIEL